MKLSEDLEQDHECGDFGDVLNGYAERAKKLEEDANRYQYLKSRELDLIKTGGVFAGRVPDNIVLNGRDLDEAVDLGIAELSQKEEFKTCYHCEAKSEFKMKTDDVNSWYCAECDKDNILPSADT